MRLLIASLASYGHTYPLLPFALAARDAGHDVDYATGPEFLPLVEKLGFRPVAAGVSLREAFGQVHAESGRDMSERFSLSGQELQEIVGRVFGDVMPRRVAADLAPVLRDTRPDLVVHEAGNTGAGLAARVAGTPGVRHGFGRVDSGGMPVVFRDHLAAVAADLGLDPGAPGGDPYLDICPESLQDAGFLAGFTGGAARRIPLRPVPFAHPGDLPGWVTEPGPPLVYLTLGTAFTQGSILRTAIDGLARLPVRVLVATGPLVDPAQVGDLPESVRVEQWVPQADLLAHASLVVHHGGSGTMLGSLVHGVPQLFLPQGADQFANAAAVTRSGAGTQIVGDELSVDAVADAASALLADAGGAAAAAAFAAEIAAMPSPAEVVEALPGLVGVRRAT